MNKLTEILDRLHDINFCRGNEYNKAVENFQFNAQSDIEYLLSLLEEKDKALEVLADKNNWHLTFTDNRAEVVWIWLQEGKPHAVAQSALTSSNNEGER